LRRLAESHPLQEGGRRSLEHEKPDKQEEHRLDSEKAQLDYPKDGKRCSSQSIENAAPDVACRGSLSLKNPSDRSLLCLPHLFLMAIPASEDIVHDSCTLIAQTSPAMLARTYGGPIRMEVAHHAIRQSAAG
jgi:hypothetical protein